MPARPRQCPGAGARSSAAGPNDVAPSDVRTDSCYGCEPPMHSPRIQGLPLVGAFFAHRSDPLGFLTRASRLGDVVGFRLGRSEFHLVSHPEGVQRILVDNAAAYHKTGPGQDLIRYAFGDGLPTSEGERWREQRRTTGPAFRSDRMGGLVPAMASGASDLVDALAASAARGDAVEITGAFAHTTLTIAGRAMFGVDLADRAGALERALGTIRDEVTRRGVSLTHGILGTSFPTPGNRRFDAAIRDLRAIAATMVAERRTAAGGDDLLAILLGAGLAAEDGPLLDQVVPLLIASHLTTSNTLTWTFWLLSQHADARERATAEVDDVLAGRTPDADDVERLVFVRAVIDEAMRLYPPGWRLVRWVAVDDEIAGVRIPRGTRVFLSPWVTHRHPAWWDAPEEFRPERFLAPSHPRFAYFPFGFGVRQCLGRRFALLEATVVVASILQRLRLDLVPGQRVGPAPLMTLAPRFGLRVCPVAR